jgi:hypothetical protein
MATIELQNDGVFRPGETLRGRVRLDDGQPSPGLELHLLWMTRGRGTEQVEVVAVRDLHDLDFSFDLPPGPPSFSGSLVGVVWAVELVDGDGESLALREFILSPTGRELRLGRIEDPLHLAGRKAWKKRL